MIKKIIIKTGQKHFIPLVWTGNESEISYSVDLTGPGAELELILVLLSYQSGSVRVNLQVNHLSPRTVSRVIVKGALSGSCRAEIVGTVNIPSGSVGADAWFTAELLLLSDTAVGQVVPNLEIAENEVKAGHHARVGRVSQEELFYLQSRGLSKKAAKKLLVQGFFNDVFSKYPLKLIKLAETKLQHII